MIAQPFRMNIEMGVFMFDACSELPVNFEDGLLYTDMLHFFFYKKVHVCRSSGKAADSENEEWSHLDSNAQTWHRSYFFHNRTAALLYITQLLKS